MKLLRIFGIAKSRILEKDCCTEGIVTGVRNSRLYVVKKPVRIGISDRNTLFSHYITFTYQADSITYTGILFISLNQRCPQTGEKIDVYYDPENPEKYACYSFGPAVRPIGW